MNFLGTFKIELDKKIDNLKTEVDKSFSSDSSIENKKDLNMKFNKIKIFGKNRKLEEDKYLVYKNMEDINNLEHKFNNMGKNDIKMSSQTFNYKFHDMKRQL